MTVMLMGRKNGHFLKPFIPTPVMKWPFAELPNAFTMALEVANFSPAKLICFETDASGFTIAGIILQQQDEVCGSVEGAACSLKINTSPSKGY